MALAPEITLRDVAIAAGVSISTASRALAGKAVAYRISHSTVETVKRSAVKLGFSPSHLARALRLKKTDLIGVVVPDISNAFFAAIASEVARVASESDLTVILADSCDSTSREQTLVKQLQSRQVEGIIVCPIGLEFGHLYEAQKSNLPLVLVDRIAPRNSSQKKSLVSVTSDHRAATRELITSLITKGHRRIGVLQGLPGSVPNDERIAGYRDALRDHRIAFDPALIAGDNFTVESGAKGTRSLLSDHRDISALFAMSNQNSLGALQSLRELGLHIPVDLSMVCFDDHPYIEFLETPLTTATQNIIELGRSAATLLIDQIQSSQSPRKRCRLVPVNIVSRGSVSVFH